MMARCHAHRMAWLGAAAVALSVVTVACASSGAVPRPFPTPDRATAPQTPAAPSTPAAPAADLPEQAETALATVVGTALSLRGVPYRNGGSDLRGFDCSGFTQYVFAQHGIALPRETREQFQVGEKIQLKELKAGDLIFFHTVAKGPSHVGIVIDDDQFVHAPSSTGVVRVEHLSLPYWSQRFIAARRVGSAELAARPLPLPFPGALPALRSTN
jgi:cell wall-associated NlpC family hydrolase